MNTKTPRLRIKLSLLATAMATAFLFLFFFVRLDHVVHTDLYRYGLQFDYAWANAYWSYSKWMVSLQMAAIVVIAISIILVLIDSKSPRRRLKYSYSALLLSGLALNVLSVFLFLQVDNIVNHDLYNFGLQFSPEWANNYWIYAKLIIALLSASSVVIILSALFIFLDTHRSAKITSYKLLSATMLLIGTVTLFWSIYSSSPFLTFIGLGLVFWGAILTYIRSDAYVKKVVFAATPPYPMINLAIRELGFKGVVIYLPPTYFRDPRRNKIFVARQDGIVFPKPEEVQEHEELPLFEIQDGIVMDASGRELATLFETTLRMDFTKIDLNYIKQNIPKLLVEQLEIATHIEITSEADKITIKLQDPIFEPPKKAEQSASMATASFGSVLASALACSLAKGTGKPITIEREETSENGRIISTEYRMLTEQGG